jgi:DNA-binding beta-propeller fold protein YncE
MKTKVLLMLALLAFAFACNEDSLLDTPNFDYTLDERTDAFPDIINLPMGFEVEGIEVGEGHDFYVTSLANGAIIKGNLQSGEYFILVAGAEGRSSVGLKFDDRSGFLFVASEDGKGKVYHGYTGELIETYELEDPGAGPLINDVIITKKAAYFTNSLNTYLYKLPLGPDGQLPPPSAVEKILMDGFVYSPDPNFLFINANGIVASPNGKKLIVNNMATGVIYLVDAKTGETTPIEIEGATPMEFIWGDGLLLDGRTLYICQNFPNKIAVVELDPGFATGTFIKNIFDPENFVEPATIAGFGNHLYAVNAHFAAIIFGGVDPAFLPFEVVKVDK